MTVRLIELFAGIGAQRRALELVGEREGISVETVAISEIDKYALKSYKALFGDCPNLGDIRNIESLPDCDILTYSFPCTSISKVGRREGMTEGSETASSLLWEVDRLVSSETHKPEWLVMENVPEVISKLNIEDFNKWLSKLSQLGYSSRWGVLNAVDFGIPQNRQRVFMVSHLNGPVPNLPIGNGVQSRLIDYLESDVPEKYYLSERRLKGILESTEREKEKGNGFSFSICDQRGVSQTISTKEGCRKTSTFIMVRSDGDKYKPAYDGDGYSLQFNGRGARGLLQSQRSPTLQGAPTIGCIDKGRVRKLTPRECWRLMGRTDEEFDKASSVVSDSQLYKQAGNSIVVPVLDAIFTKMLTSTGGQTTLTMFDQEGQIA